MAGVAFVEEMLREQSLLEATCGDLFDHIDDLLDFHKEESAADVLLLDAPAPGSPLSSRIIGGHGAVAALPPPPPTGQMMALPPPPVLVKDDAALFDASGAEVFDRKDAHIGSCDELDMDMAQLEWLSELFDDGTIPHEPSFPGVNCAAPIKASALAANAGVVLPDKMEEALFRSSSPISVLEHSSFNVAANGGSSSSSSSSASSSSESFSGSGRAWSAPVSPRPDPPVLIIPARARSKRPRPSAFPAVRAALAATETSILVPTPMYSSTSSHSDPESIAESNPHPPPMKKKKKAKKPAAPTASDADAEAEAEADADADYKEGGARALPPGTVRRCTHCQIEKTPQWRAGPLGPKTLCNACGVRYKSGRLFPEYRPAASPTFVPSIHSNSHKKVVEMRQKATRNADPFCDLLQYIRRRD